MRKALVLASTISLGLSGASSAADDNPPPPAWQGVWRGTIGNLPVHACFSDSSTSPFGAYFYLSKFLTIPLIEDGTGSLRFSEGWPDKVAAPRWMLTSVSQNAIGGTWKMGSKALPLHLIRVPNAEDCGSIEFQRPRLAGVRILRSRALKDGVAYTKLTLDHRGHFEGVVVESFELGVDRPAVKNINTRLKKPFDKGGEDSWLGCILSAFASSPWGAEHNEIFEPRMITRKWLTVNDHWDGFCGGAHPDSSNSPMLFDLTTGTEISLYSWFNDKAVKRERYQNPTEDIITLRPAFRSAIIGRWKGEEDCADTIDQADFWNVELTRTGFVFTPNLAHVIQACGEDFRIPFAKVAPYLTPEGKKNVAALQAEAVSRR